MEIQKDRVKQIIKEEYEKLLLEAAGYSIDTPRTNMTATQKKLLERDLAEMEEYDPTEPQIELDGLHTMGQDSDMLIRDYILPMVERMAAGDYEDGKAPHFNNETIAKMLVGIVKFQEKLERSRPVKVHEVRREKKRT